MIAPSRSRVAAEPLRNRRDAERRRTRAERRAGGVGGAVTVGVGLDVGHSSEPSSALRSVRTLRRNAEIDEQAPSGASAQRARQRVDEVAAISPERCVASTEARCCAAGSRRGELRAPFLREKGRTMPDEERRPSPRWRATGGRATSRAARAPGAGHEGVGSLQQHDAAEPLRRFADRCDPVRRDVRSTAPSQAGEPASCGVRTARSGPVARLELEERVRVGGDRQIGLGENAPDELLRAGAPAEARGRRDRGRFRASSSTPSAAPW